VFLLIEQVAQQIVEIRIRGRQFVSRLQALARILEIRRLKGKSATLKISPRFSGHPFIGYVEIQCRGVMTQDDIYPSRVERVTDQGFPSLTQISDSAYLDFVLAERK